MTKEKILGYYGNEMLSVKAHIIGGRAQEVAHLLLNSLSKNAKSLLISEIEKSMDEHDSLYLRLDRQSLNDQNISFADEEPIRIKLKPKGRFGGRASMKQEYVDLIS